MTCSAHRQVHIFPQYSTLIRLVEVQESPLGFGGPLLCWGGGWLHLKSPKALSLASLLITFQFFHRGSRIVAQEMKVAVNVRVCFFNEVFKNNLIGNVKEKSKCWSKKGCRVAPIFCEYSSTIFYIRASTNFWFADYMAIILLQSATTNSYRHCLQRRV